MPRFVTNIQIKISLPGVIIFSWQEKRNMESIKHRPWEGTHLFGMIMKRKQKFSIAKTICNQDFIGVRNKNKLNLFCSDIYLKMI